MKIVVNKEIVEKIEALQYEVESRKDVITQMLSNGMNTESAMFAKYHNEYQEFFVMYNKAKQEMVNSVGIGNGQSWNLDFATCELSVNESGACVSCGK